MQGLYHFKKNGCRFSSKSFASFPGLFCEHLPPELLFFFSEIALNSVQVHYFNSPIHHDMAQSGVDRCRDCNSSRNLKMAGDFLLKVLPEQATSSVYREC